MIGAIQSALQSSLSGLTAASARADKAATAIAASPTGDATGAIVDLSVAKADYKSDAAVIKTADDMQKTLLHMLDIKA